MKRRSAVRRSAEKCGEVVGTIAVTTLVAWYTLLVVHTHDPSLPVSLASPFLSPSPSSVSRPSSLDSFCTVRAFPPGANAHTCTHTRASSRVLSLSLSLSLASLFFLPPLSRRRRVEGNFAFSPPTLLIRVSTLSRPRKRGTHRDRAIY